MIPHDRAFALRARAARDSMAAIVKERTEHGGKVGESLEYIASHLFDIGLDVARLKKACGIRDNSFAMRFRRAVGSPPSKYIREHRLRIASRLLILTEVPVWQLAELVGYSLTESFSVSFHRWSGCRPLAYRRRFRHPAAGELPMLPKPELPKPVVSSRPSRAELLWEHCRDLPFADQVNFLRRERAFPDPELLRLLRKKSFAARAEGHGKSRRIAELAVEVAGSAEGASELAKEELFAKAGPAPLANDQILELKSSAWSWLGNVRRMALDFQGAERAFRTAHHYLAGLPETSLARIELFWIQALLRWYQQRFDDGQALAQQAVGAARRRADPRALADALSASGIIAKFQDDYDRALAAFEEIRHLLEPSRHPYLAFSSTLEITHIYKKQGEYRRAVAMMPRVWELVEAEEVRFQTPYVYWLEGRIFRETGDPWVAEERLSRARKGFLEQGQEALAAAVCLDLACVAACTGKVEAALEHAVGLLPLFEALQLPEAALSHKVLRGAVAKGVVDLVLLKQLEDAFERIQRVPTALQQGSVQL